MEYKPKAHFSIEKDGKTVEIVVDTDMPLGLLFDATMEFKGYVVERMIKAHKDEEDESERQMPTEDVKKEEDDKEEPQEAK